MLAGWGLCRRVRRFSHPSGAAVAVLEEVVHLEAEGGGDPLGRATGEALYERPAIFAFAEVEAWFSVFVRGTQGLVGAISGLDALQTLE